MRLRNLSLPFFLCLFVSLLPVLLFVLSADAFADETDAEAERTRDARIAWWREVHMGNVG
jgi:hypothetical protein